MEIRWSDDDALRVLRKEGHKGIPFPRLPEVMNDKRGFASKVLSSEVRLRECKNATEALEQPNEILVAATMNELRRMDSIVLKEVHPLLVKAIYHSSETSLRPYFTRIKEVRSKIEQLKVDKQDLKEKQEEMKSEHEARVRAYSDTLSFWNQDLLKKSFLAWKESVKSEKEYFSKMQVILARWHDGHTSTRELFKRWQIFKDQSMRSRLKFGLRMGLQKLEVHAKLVADRRMLLENKSYQLTEALRTRRNLQEERAQLENCLSRGLSSSSALAKAVHDLCSLTQRMNKFSENVISGHARSFLTVLKEVSKQPDASKVALEGKNEEISWLQRFARSMSLSSEDQGILVKELGARIDSNLGFAANNALANHHLFQQVPEDLDDDILRAFVTHLFCGNERFRGKSLQGQKFSIMGNAKVRKTGSRTHTLRGSTKRSATKSSALTDEDLQGGRIKNSGGEFFIRVGELQDSQLALKVFARSFILRCPPLPPILIESEITKRVDLSRSELQKFVDMFATRINNIKLHEAKSGLEFLEDDEFSEVVSDPDSVMKSMTRLRDAWEGSIEEAKRTISRVRTDICWDELQRNLKSEITAELRKIALRPENIRSSLFLKRKMQLGLSAPSEGFVDVLEMASRRFLNLPIDLIKACNLVEPCLLTSKSSRRELEDLERAATKRENFVQAACKFAAGSDQDMNKLLIQLKDCDALTDDSLDAFDEQHREQAFAVFSGLRRKGSSCPPGQVEVGRILDRLATICDGKRLHNDLMSEILEQISPKTLTFTEFLVFLLQVAKAKLPNPFQTDGEKVAILMTSQF